MSDSVRPHRWQPTRLPCPWDSPGKNTGVGCHFLLQCMKVKNESEVAQSCPTLSDSMDCSLPGSSAHEIFQARKLELVAISFSRGSSQPRDWHLFLKKGVLRSKHTDNLDILLNFNYVGVNLKKEMQHILFLTAPPTHTIFWPPDAKSWLMWKDPDVGKNWRQEEKGMTEDEMVRWHHRLNGHEFG